MIAQSSCVKVHLAIGYADMRKGMDGLAMLVQGVLKQDPLAEELVWEKLRALRQGADLASARL